MAPFMSLTLLEKSDGHRTCPGDVKCVRLLASWALRQVGDITYMGHCPKEARTSMRMNCILSGLCTSAGRYWGHTYFQGDSQLVVESQKY